MIYLPDYNICIEYNGEQHYNNLRNNFRCGVEYIQNNDKIKLKYCKENNVKLLIIPFYEFNNIDTLIKNFLSNYNIITTR